MQIIQETQQFNPIEVKVLVETQEEYNDLLEYIKNYGVKSVSSGQEPDSEGWISNIGNSTWGPPKGYGINANTRIEIKRRHRESTERNPAGYWDISWEETNKSKWDIVKFRILKD